MDLCMYVWRPSDIFTPESFQNAALQLDRSHLEAGLVSWCPALSSVQPVRSSLPSPATFPNSALTSDLPPSLHPLTSQSLLPPHPHPTPPPQTPPPAELPRWVGSLRVKVDLSTSLWPLTSLFGSSCHSLEPLTHLLPTLRPVPVVQHTPPSQPGSSSVPQHTCMVDIRQRWKTGRDKKLWSQEKRLKKHPKKEGISVCWNFCLVCSSYLFSLGICRQKSTHSNHFSTSLLVLMIQQPTERRVDVWPAHCCSSSHPSSPFWAHVGFESRHEFTWSETAKPRGKK